LVHTQRVPTRTDTQTLLGVELATAHVDESLRFYNWLVDPDVSGESDADVARHLRSKGVIAIRPSAEVPQREGWLPVFLVPDVPDGAGSEVTSMSVPALHDAVVPVRYARDSAGVLTGVTDVRSGEPASRLGGTNVDYISLDPASTAIEQGQALGLEVLKLVDDAYDAHLLCSGRLLIAGVLRFGSTFDSQARPGWLCYLGVDDVDEAISRAVAAGARILVPASHSGLNRYAVLLDPWGTPFGVSAPADHTEEDDMWVDGRDGRSPLSGLSTIV
jgi:predicted enzyme related to lactoylglutathione lyase